MKLDLETGNVKGLTDYLKEIIEEGEYMVPATTALLGRIEAIVPAKEEVKEAETEEKDNPLKNAKEFLEDDYGMIDEIINNGLKEEKQAEKPSIMVELKAAKTVKLEEKPEVKGKNTT